VTPFVADPDFTLYLGDVVDVLRELPDESVHCCVTSPPYWGLRDYGTASWDGGDPDCAHRVGGQVHDTKAPGAITTGQRPGVDASVCLDCGATRVDKQLGLEQTPEEYVARMVAVFAEVRRVLRSDGTCWLNISDSYNAYNGNRGESGSTLEGTRQHLVGRPRVPVGSGISAPGLKPKDLVGIPWRLAFALQADGWYLRSDIIWSKPNPMPESVTDRPTKAHEDVFLLTKSARYFYDAAAIREPHSPDGRLKTVHDHATDASHPNYDNMGTGNERWPNGGRNKRSVWEIATESYAEAHFATFPQALVEPCVKAGCPEWVCATCGRPRVRITERGENIHPGDCGRNDAQGPVQRGKREDGKAVGTVMRERHEAGRSPKTVGWSDCGHGNYRAGVVLDPFMGSGTTALVARRLGRRSIGCELNPEYAALAAKRLSQLSLLAEDADVA
jgi:DNA modification methylase